MSYNISFKETINKTYILTFLYKSNGYQVEINKNILLALITDDKNTIGEVLDLLEDKLNTYSILDKNSIIEFYNIEEIKDFIEWLNSRIIIKRLKIN